MKTTNKGRRVAIITGASSGIGKEFAYQIDTRNDFDEFWLIARNEERLQETADFLNHPTRLFSLDLANQEALDCFKVLVNEDQPQIIYLINAAGFGKLGADNNLEVINKMLDLNIKALVNLTYLSIPYMDHKSHLINISSLSAFMPLPGLNIYAASKAFVLHFSQALHHELKPQGIKVTAICPGWTATNFQKTAGIKKANKTAFWNKCYDAKPVVTRALLFNDMNMMSGTYGLTYNLEMILCKFLPVRLVMRGWEFQKKSL